MEHIVVRKILSGEVPIGTKLIVKGWVRTRRDSKDFSFIEINDGSCLSNVQVIANSVLANYEADVLTSNTGASVEIEGELIESAGKGQSFEVKAGKFIKLGDNGGEEYPLQKKRHTNEFLRTIAHLRPRTNTFGAVFRVRSACAYAIHKFFNEHGFIYLHTPVITCSDGEGAGEMFRVTTLDPEKVANSGKVSYDKDFFERAAYLTVTGQLEGETFASALSKIYTFGPTFRAENSHTPRHLAEFWMIEPEMAFYDLNDNMKLSEEFIKYVIKYVLDNCSEDMKFFDQWVEKGIIDSLEHVVSSEFARITYTEAVEILEKSGKQFEYPVSWGIDMQTEHERYLTEQYAKKPIFVTNYPKDIKAFYMRQNEDGKTVTAMDLLAPRIGEIIGGSQREERYDYLKKAFISHNLKEEDYWWYLDLRRFGTVPHSGFGLGFERMIMYLTGMTNIRDVIPFPRTQGNAKF